MSDQNKLAILMAISKETTAGKPVRLNYNSLGKATGLTKQNLDELLTELNKLLFISQYTKKGVDSFTVILNQKGLDAVQDESFI
jgi:RIO-like serine/threonine protein kinase